MSDRVTRIVQNYELKTRLGANGRLSEREIMRQVNNYGHAVVRDDTMLTGVRQVLCSRGVSTIMFASYHAFARELAKFQRQGVTGESMSYELAMLVAKWVARGLEQAALVDIAMTVFAISMPKPPADGKQPATQ